MRLLIFVGLIFAGIAAFLKSGEGLLVYPFDPRYVRPSQAGEPRLHEVKLITSDDETLVIWHAEAKSGKPTILYFHGNGGGLADRVQRFDRLLDRGYGLIAPAYRRSSGSTGTPSEAALSSDALEILGYFAPQQPLIYYGESLGTGVAVKLARRKPPLALLLEAPYTSIPDVVDLTYSVPGLRALMRENWHTEENIKLVTAPTLIIHGTDDQIVPFSLGQRVYAASPAPVKTFIRAQGLGHSNLWTPKNQGAIYRFIDALP